MPGQAAQKAKVPEGRHIALPRLQATAVNPTQRLKPGSCAGASWRSPFFSFLTKLAHVTVEQIILCVICGKRILLESAKTDAYGEPVHEECYAKKIKTKSTPPQK